MKKILFGVALSFLGGITTQAQDKIFPGADENTVSKAQYFSWINNTNEGATEQQTLINLDFFKWLHDEYGMILDIYAFDAGLIDGKGFYGSTKSDRFKSQFPQGLGKVYQKAKGIQTRLGVWGGPDGFGDSPEEATERINQMVSLCKDYEWALFKFDAVCGPLRMDKEDEFIQMMKECRKYSPDLILLNHRLGLKKSKPYATTFLWGGMETYVDVHARNNVTANHHRVGNLDRGLTPQLLRLTEDHGVCLSSCLDYWEDDLILQAFNRSLILAPEIYGNPWLLADSEFSKLARIYNLHRKYGNILIKGMELPESYGSSAVSRGDAKTRFITMRNLSWNEETRTIHLDKEIGLTKRGKVQVRIYHPFEQIVGTYQYGDQVKVKVPAFRSILLSVSVDSKVSDAGLYGSAFEVIKDKEDTPLEMEVLGMPGETVSVKLNKSALKRGDAYLEGVKNKDLSAGKEVRISFPGEKLNKPPHRFLGKLDKSNLTGEEQALYDATVFAADNNALEVRSLKRSGETKIKEVKAARDAFFNQKAFINRGIWDKYLFDGDMNTGFWPSRRYRDQRINRGCFRLDLGREIMVDSIVIKVGNFFEFEPLKVEEGNQIEISTDLRSWKTQTFLSNLTMSIPVQEKMRYMKFRGAPGCIREVEVYSNGRRCNSQNFRASNLFAHTMKAQAVWKKEIILDEIAKDSYLSVAINGEHGVEGAYAALKVDGKLVGAPDRAVSYPCNEWEFLAARSSKNYTYYFPIDESMKNKKIEVFVMGYDKENLNFSPEVWISAYPNPFERKHITIK